MGSSKNQVRVWCRIKPTSEFASDVINISPDKKKLIIHLKEKKVGAVNHQAHDWVFKLDGILHNVSQEEVYNDVAADFVRNALTGYNGTILSYGQTGAGKTFTISGVHENFQYRGLIPRAISQLFKQIQDFTENVISVRVSYLEIYNETLFDLLSTLPEYEDNFVPEQLNVIELDRNVYVKGLSYHLVRNEEEALNLLFEGETNRIIGQHSLNSHSSRSHCIFTIFVESHSAVESNSQYTISKLNFVDLAGSERMKKTQHSVTKTHAESVYINKSLSFLEQVVVAMADKKREHIPFRQSKLTYFLKDSLGGNSNTVLIANIWGEINQIEETISTLRFATRMMCVPMIPTPNKFEDHKIMVKKMKKEITQLRMELAMHNTLANKPQVNYEQLNNQQKLELKKQLENFLRGTVDALEIINISQIHALFEIFREMYLGLEESIKIRMKALENADHLTPEIITSLPDSFPMVGEIDSPGFNIGTTTKSGKTDGTSVVQMKKAAREKEKRRSKDGLKLAETNVTEKKSDEIVTVTSENNSEKLNGRSSSPLPRSIAFEEFKLEHGSEINKELSSNKEKLNRFKRCYVTMAREINVIKCEIDSTRNQLEQTKDERIRGGTLYTAKGSEAISEEEFELVKTLKYLKRDYRFKFDQLLILKKEVSNWQNLVNNSRHRLIQEFENWFVECFLPTGDDAASGTQRYKLNASLENELEKFDRLQNELMILDDLSHYQKSYISTQHRKNFSKVK